MFHRLLVMRFCSEVSIGVVGVNLRWVAAPGDRKVDGAGVVGLVMVDRGGNDRVCSAVRLVGCEVVVPIVELLVSLAAVELVVVAVVWWYCLPGRLVCGIAVLLVVGCF